MIELREFTKNDWMAFSGTERFEDGSEPLIAEGEGYTVLVDKIGVNIVVEVNPGEEFEEYPITFERGSKKISVAVAKEIIERLDGATNGIMAKDILFSEYDLL